MLTENKIKYALAYAANGGNQSAAYRDAYGAEGASAGSAASELMKSSEVKMMIKVFTDPAMDLYGATADRIIRELSFVAFFDISQIFDEDGNLRSIKEIPLATRRAIASLDIQAMEAFMDEDDETGKRKSINTLLKKLRTSDKLKALEQLCKIKGLNAPDRLDLSNTEPFKHEHVHNLPGLEARLDKLIKDKIDEEL